MAVHEKKRKHQSCYSSAIDGNKNEIERPNEDLKYLDKLFIFEPRREIERDERDRKIFFEIISTFQ